MDNKKFEQKKIEIKKLKEPETISNNKIVRVTKMKNIIDILSMNKEPVNMMKYKKMSKTEYVNIETGEILEYKLNENRGQNIAGLKKTFKTIRNLINNNFIGAENELFITLTYKENMTETKKLYDDFKMFIKKVRNKYKNIDYISIVEPQGRGAWHCHVLIKFSEVEKIYIDNNTGIYPLWKHGWTKTRKLDNVDNIGAYLNAYMTDIELNDENEMVIAKAVLYNHNAWEKDILDDGTEKNKKLYDEYELKTVEKEVVQDDGKKVKKKYVKGARLYLYPSGMNLYRCSKGIKKPETEKMIYKDIKKIVGSRKADYARTIKLERGDEHVNTITYEQYNLKRKKMEM